MKAFLFFYLFLAVLLLTWAGCVYYHVYSAQPTEWLPVSDPPRDFDRGWYPTEVASLPAIRRLHLVRPDLIPYPLCIETYC